MTTAAHRIAQALLAQPALHTPRLLLRKPRAEDAEPLVSILNDWEIARALARIPHPYTADDAAFFLNEVVTQELVWAIIDTQSGQLIGMIGLMGDADHPDRIEIGYYIARSHWGQGYASEAGRAVIDYAHRRFDPSWLHACYFSTNTASGRVLAKLGFVETGRSERPCLATGTDMPSVEVRFAVG